MRISDWSSDVCSADLTLGHMAGDKRRRIARETLDIYAPIAQRLGIYFIRTELVDLAFANLYPNRYSVMVKSVKAQLGDTRKLIREVEQTLATALREEGIGASVVGRAGPEEGRGGKGGVRTCRCG